MSQKTAQKFTKTFPALSAITDPRLRETLQEISGWSTEFQRLYNSGVDSDRARDFSASVIRTTDVTGVLVDYTEFLHNAYLDDNKVYRKVDPTAPSYSVRMTSSPDKWELLYCAAGTDPISWTVREVWYAGLSGSGYHAAQKELQHVCQGRLTLTSGRPVIVTNQLNAATVYWTPYNGNTVALYDNRVGVIPAGWRLVHITSDLQYTITLLGQAVYDVFIDYNGGTPALKVSNPWVGASRTDALALQDGVWVKSGTPSWRYVGSIRPTAPGLVSDTYDTRCVYNYYNRIQKGIYSANDVGTNSPPWIVLGSSPVVYVLEGSPSGYGEGQMCVRAHCLAMYNATAATGGAYLGVGVFRPGIAPATLWGTLAASFTILSTHYYSPTGFSLFEPGPGLAGLCAMGGCSVGGAGVVYYGVGIIGDVWV